MPPLLTEEEAALDPYTVLSVALTSSEPDIRRAYRRLSLKYHPDRNPAPEAAIKFRELSLSLEILVDPAKRSYVDNKLEGERRRKEKYAELDKKRKVMVDALVAREEAAKKAKVDAVERRKAAAEEENIKEAGRRMLEEAQKRAMATAATAAASRHHASPASQPNGHGKGASVPTGASASASAPATTPSISPTDLTLILTLPGTTPLLSTPSPQSVVEGLYGPVSHFILKDASASGTDGSTSGKKRKRRAVVEFKQGNWGGCWACWTDHAPESDSGAGVGAGAQSDNADVKRRRGGGLGDGVRAKWLAGSTPEWVAWADKQALPLARGGDTNGVTEKNANGHAPPSRASASASAAAAASFASAPDFSAKPAANHLDEHAARQDAHRAAKAAQDDYESMTLFRMRQLERDRLADEIRRQEEAEE